MFFIIFSKNRDILRKVEQGRFLNYKMKLGAFNGSEVWLFNSEIVSPAIIQSIRSINDINDYNHQDIIRGILNNGRCPEIMTVLSVAYNHEGRFICMTDCWGLFPFYYYQKNGDVIISDNIFLIAGLMNCSFCEETYFDTLFFSRPKGHKSFYNDINTIQHGQILILDYSNGETRISSPVDIYKILGEKSRGNLVNQFNRLVEYNSKQEEVHLSLSAGSDSNVLLGTMLFCGKVPICHSWGDKRYYEIQLIEQYIKRLGLKWLITSFEGLYEDYQNKIIEATFITSGNNHTLHHSHYYGKNSEILLYEGYFGSEFAKGELSDGMFTPAMRMILTGQSKMKEALDFCYEELEPEIYGRFVQYISDTYIGEVININNKDGFEKFKRHFFTFVPARKFSPLAQIADQNKITLVWPFLNIDFLRALFSAGYGLMNMASLRADFNPRKAIYPQYIIASNNKSPILKTVLDRNISLNDASRSDFQFYLAKKYNSLRRRLTIHRAGTIYDQVDYAENRAHIEGYLMDKKDSFASDKLKAFPVNIRSSIVRQTTMLYELLQDARNYSYKNF